LVGGTSKHRGGGIHKQTEIEDLPIASSSSVDILEFRGSGQTHRKGPLNIATLIDVGLGG